MHGFLKARVIAPSLHLILFLVAWIPRVGGFVGAKASAVAFLLIAYLDFPVNFLSLVMWRFGAVYTLAAMLVLTTVWWFFIGFLIERAVWLYRRE
jgi:hypothetical protein